MRVEFIVDGQPIGKARPRVTRTVTFTPKRTSQYEELVRYAATSNFEGYFEKGCALDVKIIAYFGVPKSYTKKRRENCLAGIELPTKKPDIDNIGKIVLDGMNPKLRKNKQLHKMVEVMRGIYQDDQQVTYLTVKKRYADRARVEVRVKEDEGKYDWALDSALKALSREDKKAFMNRIWDMSVVSNMSQTYILYMFAQSAYSTSLISSFIYGGHK